MNSRPPTPPYVPFGIRRFDRKWHCIYLYSSCCFNLFRHGLVAIHFCDTLSFQPTLSQIVFYSKLAVFSTTYRIFKLQETSYRSVLPAIAYSTMTSADFSWQSYFIRTYSIWHPHVHETSPSKNNRLHLIYLPHLRYGIRVVLDFVLFSKLIRLTTP